MRVEKATSPGFCSISSLSSSSRRRLGERAGRVAASMEVMSGVWFMAEVTFRTR